jgi:hypothetical protein
MFGENLSRSFPLLQDPHFMLAQVAIGLSNSTLSMLRPGMLAKGSEVSLISRAEIGVSGLILGTRILSIAQPESSIKTYYM